MSCNNEKDAFCNSDEKMPVISTLDLAAGMDIDEALEYVRLPGLPDLKPNDFKDYSNRSSEAIAKAGSDKKTIDEVTDLMIYPNPTMGAIILDFNMPEEGIIQLYVYDIAGRLVHKKACTQLAKGRQTIKAENFGLVAGQYYVKLQVEKEIFNKTFVVKHEGLLFELYHSEGVS
jgi:hypothetical protein